MKTDPFMNDIICIELADLQNRLHLIHCIDIGIIIFCILGFFFIQKIKILPRFLFLVGIICAIAHYFQISEQLSDKRIERIIDSVNLAGLPTDYLKELNIPGKGSTETFKIILGERKSNQEYKFEVLSSFWDADTLQIRLIN